MQTVNTVASATNEAKPIKMYKRIGSTVYEVQVYFNQDAKETMDAKILRLIKNEVLYGKVAG